MINPVDDYYTFPYDGILDVPHPGVRINDTDIDDTWACNISSYPGNYLNFYAFTSGNGDFIYEPNPGTLNDFFSYYLYHDGSGLTSSTATVYLTATGVPPSPESGSLSLYIYGHAPHSGNIGLYIGSALTSSSGMTLAIEGLGVESGQMTLFVHGYAESGEGISLFTHGHEPASGNMPLYIYGHETETRSLPLFIRSDPLGGENNDLTLVMYATAQSGIIGNVDMHTYSDESGNIAQRYLPLVLAGADNDFGVRYLNLVIYGVPYNITDDVNLYVCNTESGIDLSCSLFVSGEGMNNGWSPQNSYMNLMIMRDPAASMNLYTAGPGTPTDSGVSMYVQGGVYESGNLPMAISNVVGAKVASARLFTSGW